VVRGVLMKEGVRNKKEKVVAVVYDGSPEPNRYEPFLVDEEDPGATEVGVNTEVRLYSTS
jgi:hypothetical protein